MPADWLRPQPHVVPRVQRKPAVPTVTPRCSMLGPKGTAARDGLAADEVSRCLAPCPMESFTGSPWIEGLEGDEQGRRRPAWRGQCHGWHGGGTRQRGRAPVLGANARALGCARAWRCERLGLGPGVGHKAAGRRSSRRSSGRRKKGGGGHGTRGRARTRAGVRKGRQ
jgi:hypothetical protein